MSNKVYIRDNSGAWKDICGCKGRKADNTWGTITNGDKIRDNAGNWVNINCSFPNEMQQQVFNKNDCDAGYGGTAVNYRVNAATYYSVVSTADANSTALADIVSNGQSYTNAHGTCILSSLVSTLLVDYYDDGSADLCMYCHTTGVAETDIPVTAPENNSGTGVARYPNDSRDPSGCYLLSSNRLTASGRVKMRFGMNMAYFIATYPAIDHFTFIIRGRGLSDLAISGIYALRDVSQGHLIMPETFSGSGLYIPSVSSGSTLSIVGYSSHIISGRDGTTGIAVGSPVLQLDYIVSTNTLTKTTY